MAYPPVQAPFGAQQQPFGGSFPRAQDGFYGGGDASPMSGQMGAASPASSAIPLDEPPILEELGIFPDQILARIKSVVFFKDIDQQLVSDTDMGGPLIICTLLGVSLVFAGKLHFGYIYGISMIGSVGTNILVNLMSPKGDIDLYRTMSILGYGLLPTVFLAFIGIFVSLHSFFGFILGVIVVPWCTLTASRFFERAVNNAEQRFLIAYPIAIFYAAFCLITVF
jgi:hypothetical protein